MFEGRLLTAGIVTLLACRAAHAQAEPSGLMKRSTASSGKTEVATEGFEATTEAKESKDATELSVNAGAFMAAGNARTVAATVAEQFRLRRGVHQFSLASGINYGGAAADADSGMETTVENYQSKARYDHFLSERFALFLGVSARRDRFQGLALRVNFAPGAAYYVIAEKEHRLWGELGYNLQHDVRTDEALAAALEEEASTVDDSETRHFGRAFVGYGNTVSETVAFETGLEYLLGVAPFEDDETRRENWRLSWTGGVNAKVSDRFSLATTVTIDYDNNPVPGVERTDASTAINLVYTLL